MLGRIPNWVYSLLRLRCGSSRDDERATPFVRAWLAGNDFAPRLGDSRRTGQRAGASYRLNKAAIHAGSDSAEGCFLSCRGRLDDGTAGKFPQIRLASDPFEGSRQS